VSAAKRVALAAETVRAAWERQVVADPQTDAAQALEDAGLLMSPEKAAELWDLRTRLAGMANPPRELFLALYDGAEPELFTTVEAARECCDDLAPTDAYGKGWDWLVNEHGVHVQFWTHPDDDRPLSETSGSVTPIVVQGVEPVSELESLRARVAELEVERNSTNEALDDAVQALRKGESAEVLALTVYRAEYDPGVPLGTYTNLKAAQQHCETFVRCEEADGDRLSFDWIPDDEDDPAIWELVVQRGEDETTTGYCVAVVDVASAFDEEADE